MPAQIIVTGFKPFSIYPVNSSWEAAKILHQHNREIIIRELHVDRTIAHHEICDLLAAQTCNVLLLSGLTYQNHISLEAVARKPPELLSLEGPEIMYSAWPLKEGMNALQSFNIPAVVSEDAGEYVCESVLWSALNFRRINRYPGLVGFIHVPPISDEWEVSRIAKAMEITLMNALQFL